MFWRTQQKLRRLRKWAIHLWQSRRTRTRRRRHPASSIRPAGLPKRQPDNPAQAADVVEFDPPDAQVDSASTEGEVVEAVLPDAEASASTAVHPDSTSSDEATAEPDERPDPQATSVQERSVDSPPTHTQSSPRDGPKRGKKPRLMPGKRHERPRSPGTSPSSTSRNGTHRESPGRWPELRCREVSGAAEWEVELALFDGYEASEVRYDGGVLEPPEDGSCLLPGLGGNLVVAPHCDPSRVTRFDLTPPLIFKTKKHYKGPGRQVRRLTQGCFIVIVPADWKWTGPQPQVEPAFTSIEGYQAHFVHGTTSDDDIGGFDKTGSLPRAMDRYLIGTTVHDDDEYGGPLFVGQYPELVNVDDFEWAIVGEEGESPGWRTRFKLSKRTLGEVLEERESGPGQHRGWLFLRLHDATPSLVASSCFRYFPEHLQVCVDDQPYTPSPRLPDDAGHRQARLTFTATPSTTIRLTVRSGHVLDDHAVLIPEHRDDEVSVVLSTETHSVSVLVSLPRVWWRLLNQSRTDDSQEGKNDWAARPLRLTRQRFETLALAGTILQLHAPHTRQVMCGFDFAEKDSAVRTYRSTTAPTIDILLDDFLDDAALDDDPRRHASLDMSSNQWPHNVSAIHVLPEIAAGEIVATDADTPSDGAEPVLPLPATPESVLPVEGTQRYDCGEYLVRHEPSHTWEVARRQGFVSIPNQRHLPGPGSRIWVCVARGYVGVGRVLGTSERVQQPKASSNQESASHQVLKVRWLDTRHASRAVPFGETLAMPWDALAVPSAGGNLAAPWFRWTVGRLKLNFHGWNTEVKDDA